MRSLLVLALFLSGCSGSECDTQGDVERAERLGAFEVHESMHIASCFQDSVYERVITLQARGVSREVGRYSDEGRMGLTRLAQDHGVLAIFSGSHVYLVDVSSTAHMDEAPVHAFMPYDAAGFAEAYASVNGHYDLEAAALSIEGNAWILRYDRLANHGAASEGAPLEFISRDRGEHFALRAR